MSSISWLSWCIIKGVNYSTNLFFSSNLFFKCNWKSNMICFGKIKIFYFLNNTNWSFFNLLFWEICYWYMFFNYIILWIVNSLRHLISRHISHFTSNWCIPIDSSKYPICSSLCFFYNLWRNLNWRRIGSKWLLLFLLIKPFSKSRIWRSIHYYSYKNKKKYQ